MFLETLAMLNNNKIVWGLTMVLLNMGSKYVLADLGRVHEKVLAHELAKKIIVFSMFFVATRDIMISFVLSVLYVIIIDGIFHEKRNFTIIKNEGGAHVQEAEYQRAKELVALYEMKQAQDTSKNSIYEKYINNIYTLRHI